MEVRPGKTSIDRREGLGTQARPLPDSNTEGSPSSNDSFGTTTATPRRHHGGHIIPNPIRKTLVLGLGNVIMGDEGIGVHVVRALAQEKLPASIECLDGGTGGFILLEPLQLADRILLVDATADDQPYGTVSRTTPKFAKDYPPTLTAHDIGVKDLLDAFYMQGGTRDVILYAISINPKQPISMELSEAGAQARDEAVRRIVAELEAVINFVGMYGSSSPA